MNSKPWIGFLVVFFVALFTFFMYQIGSNGLSYDYFPGPARTPAAQKAEAPKAEAPKPEAAPATPAVPTPAQTGE